MTPSPARRMTLAVLSALIASAITVPADAAVVPGVAHAGPDVQEGRDAHGAPSAQVPPIRSAVDDEPHAPGYPWAWPVTGPRVVTAPFRAPAHDYGPGHRGIDIAAAIGTRVMAPASGVVAFRGTVVDRPVITVDHGDGFVTTFEPVSSDLKPGDVVEQGSAVGEVSVGGHSVRGTVHVGVRLHDEYINPRPLFGEVPRAVLLPCCS